MPDEYLCVDSLGLFVSILIVCNSVSNIFALYTILNIWNFSVCISMSIFVYSPGYFEFPFPLFQILIFVLPVTVCYLYAPPYSGASPIYPAT